MSFRTLIRYEFNASYSKIIMEVWAKKPLIYEVNGWYGLLCPYNHFCIKTISVASQQCSCVYIHLIPISLIFYWLHYHNHNIYENRWSAKCLSWRKRNLRFAIGYIASVKMVGGRRVIVFAGMWCDGVYYNREIWEVTIRPFG